MIYKCKKEKVKYLWFILIFIKIKKGPSIIKTVQRFSVSNVTEMGSALRSNCSESNVSQ